MGTDGGANEHANVGTRPDHPYQLHPSLAAFVRLLIRRFAHIGLIGPHGGKARANSAVKHFYNMPNGSTDSSWHLLLGYMASWRLPATLNPHRDVPRAKASQKGPSAPYVSQRAARPCST